MKRSELISVLAIAQWLLSAVYALVAVYLLSGAVRELSAGDDWADRFIFFGTWGAVFAIVAGTAGYGMWKLKLWGQVLSLLHIGFWVAVFGDAWYKYGNWDHQMLPIVAGFALLLVLHVLPATWQAFRARSLETI